MNFILPKNYDRGNPNGLIIKENPRLNEPGVYIIGVKAFVSKTGIIVENSNLGKEYFLPIYTGMVEKQSQLKGRISSHYNLYSNLNPADSFRGGLFNFSLDQDVCKLYDSIEIFNKGWIEVIIKPKPKGSWHKHHFYCELDELEEYGITDYLVYFQCSSFLNFKLNLKIPSSCWYDMTQVEVYNKYSTTKGTSKLRARRLAEAYVNLKHFIRENFYFVYLPLPNFNNDQILEKEAESKFFLKKEYNIYLANQLETPIGINRYNWLIQNPLAFENPFGFDEPNGSSLDSIIFKRNILCSTPNPVLVNILTKIKNRLGK